MAPHGPSFALVLAFCLAAPAPGDVVTDWNSMYQEAVRQTGGPPCPISRAGAIVHAAMYDAINSIVRTHEPYVMLEDTPSTTSREAAVAVAAHATLLALYPEPALLELFDALLDTHLSAIPDGPDKVAGIELGTSCATRMMETRIDDGSDNDDPYTSGKGPGYWIPTPPQHAEPASPNWPGVTPFTMLSFDQFRPTGPAGYSNMTDLLLSPEYAVNYNEVKEIGAIDSLTRTAEQTFIARFWANDRDGTYKPPGHLNDITQVIAAQQGNTLFDNARLFALLNLALGDAGIVAWDTKYSTDIDLWRPVTGIRQGNTDGNLDTVVDQEWTPLSHDPDVNGFTPNFPAYSSGHSTFGAAHAAVLREFYGTDDISFTIGSDDTPGEFRSFDSLTAAALENGRSRVYLGVHWQFDADAGFSSGSALGEWVAQNKLRPFSFDIADILDVLANWGPCPPEGSCQGDIDGNGVVGFLDLLLVLSNWGD